MNNEDFYSSLRQRLDQGMRDGVSDDDLALLAFHSLFAVGAGFGEEFGPYAAAIYNAAIRRLPAKKRGDVVFSVVKHVSQADITAEPLVLILSAETDSTIVSHAAQGLITFTAPDDECVSSGMTLLKRMVTEKKAMNRGGAFGAAVSLGDHALAEQIDEMRADLTPEEIEIAALSEAGQALSAAIDFWIRFAEDAVRNLGSEAKPVLIPIGIALEVIPSKSVRPTVVDVERQYPSPPGAEVRIVKEWPIREYAALIAPRLYAIEDAETSPRVFSSVLKAWGLEPVAPEEQQFSYPAYYAARAARAN